MSCVGSVGARCPRPGAALSHSTTSRPPAGAKARPPAIVIVVLLAVIRYLPFVSTRQLIPCAELRHAPDASTGLEHGARASHAVIDRHNRRGLLPSIVHGLR